MARCLVQSLATLASRAFSAWSHGIIVGWPVPLAFAPAWHSTLSSFLHVAVPDPFVRTCHVARISPLGTGGVPMATLNSNENTGETSDVASADTSTRGSGMVSAWSALLHDALHEAYGPRHMHVREKLLEAFKVRNGRGWETRDMQRSTKDGDPKCAKEDGAANERHARCNASWKRTRNSGRETVPRGSSASNRTCHVEVSCRSLFLSQGNV